MARNKHRRPRDLPHPQRRGSQEWLSGRSGRRIPKGDGTSWPSHSVGEGVPPKAPPITLLYDDLANPEQPVPVFGQYPRDLIRKLLPWLRCERREILHVCSGSLPPGEGLRVDVRRDARPDVLADGRALPLRDSSVAAVMIDPPYTEHYARELYGTDYPRPSHLLAEAVRVVRPCGRVAIVHYITPNPPDRARLVKVFGLSMGFGFPMRAVTIFEREQDAFFGGAA
jgi:hypothetical protein